ncbi:hypothetical protein RB598_003003 [Gaeumannomyces tritici]
MSPDSLHRRTASSGSFANDDSVTDVENPSCSSSPASVDEPRLGSRLAASRIAGVSSLINRLNRQNLWPDTQDDHPDSVLVQAAVPQSPSDISMSDLDTQEEKDQLPNAPIHAMGETPVQAAAPETPESISDLRGLTREQHLRQIRRNGPADRTKMLSLLEGMMVKSDQCNVRRPSISRGASAPRPIATTGPPSASTAVAPSAATPSASTPKIVEASKAMPRPSRPPPLRPAEGCADVIEVDSAEDDDEDAWQSWQKGRETAALLRAAKAPAGIRKNGLARMHYTSQEVALRCPNVVMSKPRMRKRRKEAEDPAKASGRGGPPSISAALPTP